jgi:hypothetical protein
MEKAMNNLNTLEKNRCTIRHTTSWRIMLPVFLLTAITATSSFAASENNFGEVTLKPGASETCNSVPCIVYFVMPPGSGNYVVLANDMKAGDYPAGETVMVGKYWAGPTVFKIQGGDFSTAKLWVIGEDD